MAMSKDAPTAAPRGMSSPGTAWLLVPAYLAGLALLFGGERIFSGYDTLRWGLSGLGLCAVLGVTAVRFAMTAKREGERRVMERRLALCSLGGLIALAGYFATTDTGMRLFGVATAAPDVRARYDGILTVGFVSLLVISVVPMLFGEAALAPMRTSERPEARRVKHAILGGMSMALAAVYGSLVVYGAGELEIKADYSYFRTAKVSESTRKVALGMEDELVARAFFPPVNDVGAEVMGYLTELQKQSPNLQVELHDRLLVPTLAKEHKVTQDGVVVLARGDARERIVIGAEWKSAAKKLKTLDGDMQKALLKLLRTKRTAYFTIGHGELNEPSTAREKEGRSTKFLREILESQNYTVKDLGVGQGLATEIPEDAGMVIVVGPQTPLLPEAVDALRRYADGGGKLLFAIDADSGADHSGLTEIVGVGARSVRIVNDKTYLKRRHNDSDRANLLVTGDARRGGGYSSHASVSTLNKGGARAGVIFAGATALMKVEGAEDKVDFVIRSSRSAFLDEDGDFQFATGNEKRGIQNLAAAVTRPAKAPAARDDPAGEEGATAPSPKAAGDDEMRAFVIGDADVLTDVALKSSDWNKVLFLDAVRWLGGEESFAGELSSTEDVRIEHTKEQDAVWFYSSIVVVPAAVFGLGLWRSNRRKRKAAASRAGRKRPAKAKTSHREKNR